MKMIITEVSHEFEPETAEEQKEYKALFDRCVSQPVSVLITLLPTVSEPWKQIMLAQQIVDDIADFICMEELYE